MAAPHAPRFGENPRRMPFNGSFKSMPLTDLLQFLATGKRTGLLVVRSPVGVTKRIWTAAGEIYAAASNDPREYLGHFLISRGLITEKQLETAMTTQEQTGIKLGKILITVGAVEEESLEQALQTKIQETVFSLFLWPEADFEFLEDEKIAGDLVHSRSDLTFLLMEGTRRADEYQRIGAAMPALLATVLELTGVYPSADTAEDYPFAIPLLERLEGTRSLQSVMLDLHALEYETLAAAMALVEAGAARIVTVKEDADAGWQKQLQEQFYDKAFGLFVKGEYAQAGNLCHYLIQNNIRASEAKKMLDECDAKTRVDFDAEVPLDAVPVLSKSLTELANQSLSAQEGFLCSRMDGHYSIRSILKITPIPESEARRAIYNLKQKGVVTLKEAKK